MRIDDYSSQLWTQICKGKTTLNPKELLILFCLAMNAEQESGGLHAFQIAAYTNISLPGVRMHCRHLVKIKMAHENGHDRWTCGAVINFPRINGETVAN